jgi:glycosyltransferase involved in cell wall biosynthesis
MRICLVSQEYPPDTASGGLGSQTHLKAAGLAALGHDVVVIARSRDHTRYTVDAGPVRVLRIPGFFGRLSMYSPAVEWLSYSAEVAVAIEEVNQQSPLDILDFAEWGGEGYVHLLNRTEWNYIPTVVQLHGPLVMFAHQCGWPEIDSHFYRVGTTMEATSLQLADAVYTSGSSSRDWCARHYGIQPENVPLIHTGVDTRHFFPRPIPKDRAPSIVFVGKIVGNKGIRKLAEAAIRLAGSFPGLTVRVLGDGDPALIGELRTMVAEAGFPDLLDIVGYVPNRCLPEHLSRADVFALPSSFEGGPGFAYLEAMACGLPVIGCSGTGVADVVVPGETGLLVPPDDVDALASALRYLLSCPEDGAAMGERARQFVLREADSSVCLRRLESFYETVVSQCESKRITV